jgi:large subunit ribosomal protein L15
MADEQRTERIGLHSLKPAPGSRKQRKRVGRGEGSGTGKTAGRGQKGYGSRSGAKDRARFEGGQMPIHMRMRKLRGPHMKKSMPFEKFRTQTQPVNLRDLEARFDKGAEITPGSLRENGLATRREVPVKILGQGDLSKALTVHAHGFSKTAREKIEAAGGTCQLIEE